MCQASATPWPTLLNRCADHEQKGFGQAGADAAVGVVTVTVTEGCGHRVLVRGIAVGIGVARVVRDIANRVVGVGGLYAPVPVALNVAQAASPVNAPVRRSNQSY